ncbi:MAG: fused MFS/spermidine synthase [Pseudolabrys sp.]|nr:fused MFS/spermidine synthase [Pseudolabrys sp.]
MSKVFALLCAAIFCLSGAASLVFQVAWRRVLAQEIGIDYAAVTIVVAIFITGLGLGGLLGGVITRSERLSGRRLPLCYAACEFGIACYGLVSEPLLRFIGSATARAGVHGLPTLLACYLVALLPATVLMGATLPLMLQLGQRFIAKLGANVGILYGANIAGAAFGALAADFWLLEVLGIRATVRTVSLANLAIAVVFVALAATRPANAPQRDRPIPDGPHVTANLMLLSGLFGFITLSLEMILFRVTAHYFQGDAYAFSIMLFWYLLMMGAGNYVFASLTDRIPVERVIVVATIGFFAALLVAFNARDFLAVVHPGSTIVVPGAQTWENTDADRMIAAAVIMLPVFFVSGLFPCMVRSMTARSAGVGHAAARVYFAFSLGNGLGVAVTGLAIVPMLGTIGATRLLVAMTALGTIALVERTRRAAPRFAAEPAR